MRNSEIGNGCCLKLLHSCRFITATADQERTHLCRLEADARHSRCRSVSLATGVLLTFPGRPLHSSRASSHVPRPPAAAAAWIWALLVANGEVRPRTTGPVQVSSACPSSSGTSQPRAYASRGDSRSSGGRAHSRFCVPCTRSLPIRDGERVHAGEQRGQDRAEVA